MPLYLTNENINITLPEIDNVPELFNEKRNEIKLEDHREEIIDVFSRKDRKLVINLLKKIVNLNGFSSEEILEKNVNWVRNIFKFSKEISIKNNFIKERSFYKDNRLAKNGFLTKNIDLKNIASAAEKLFKEKKKKYNEKKTEYRWDNIAEADESILKQLNKEFEKKGLLNEARSYLKRNVRVRNSYIILSKPNDSQYKHFLRDIENFEKKYINFHIDPKGGLIKAMLYLNYVDEKAGPFQIVKKSINSNIDPLKNIFARSISTANYCDSFEKRILINSLPKGLRSSLNFGRMLKEESKLTNFINHNLSTITSDEANTILFIPNRTIHRGAVCESKNRFAMQIHIY